MYTDISYDKNLNTVLLIFKHIDFVVFLTVRNLFWDF